MYGTERDEDVHVASAAWTEVYENYVQKYKVWGRRCVPIVDGQDGDAIHHHGTAVDYDEEKCNEPDTDSANLQDGIGYVDHFIMNVKKKNLKCENSSTPGTWRIKWKTWSSMRTPNITNFWK